MKAFHQVRPWAVAFIVHLLNGLSGAATRRGIHLGLTLLWLNSSVASAGPEKNPLLQAGFFSQEWTVDDGLPHNIINQIVQDPRGFLWIASIGGLVRFDGHQFKEVPLAKPAGEHNHTIRDLALDPSGNLLILPASGGIFRLRNGAATAHPASATLAGKGLFVLFAEPSGVTWVSAEGELVRWENGSSQSFCRGQEIPALSGRYTFARDAQGRLWIATGEYFGHYEDGKLIWRPERIGPNVLVAPSRSGGVWVSSSEQLVKLQDGKLTTISAGPTWQTPTRSSAQQLFEDRQGNLWIGTKRNGLLCFAENSLVSVQVPAENVTTILQDSEDNIWVGTYGGGICRLRRKTFISLDHVEGPGESVRTSFCEDSTGALWLANRRSTLARYYKGQVQHYTTAPARPQEEMYLVCPDKKGILWVYTSSGLYTISTENPTKLEPHPSGLKDIRILFCAENGVIWAVHGDAGIGYFHQGIFRECAIEDRRPTKRIRVLAEGPTGEIWIGSGERSLLQYTDGEFVERFSDRQVPGGILISLLIDSRGDFWLATSDGLVLKRGSHFQRFASAEGLSDELISQILQDDLGNLWCANRRGFSAVPKEELLAVAEERRTRVRETTLGKAEGFPKAFAVAGLPPIAWKARDGRLWFSTHGGFIGIDPASALTEPPAVPVYIDEVEVDKRLANISEPLDLSAGDHQVTYRFVAIHFSSPRKIHLMHQLVGYDADWVQTGTDRTASYAHLPPGHYRMRVATQTQDGSWSPTMAELPLTIPPAWWQTWLFRGVAILAVATAFAWLIRHWSQRRLRARLEDLERERQLERERARIARDLHDELGYSVTQIGLIADRLKHGSTADLSEGLGELASCTRRLSGDLESVVWTVSPKNDNWDRLAPYIRQFALNFFSDTAISCTVEGVEGAPPGRVAPEVQHHLLAMIKESLNNILKHARATRVELSLAFVRSIFTLRIVDNGVGFNHAAPEHSERNGLINLRTRASEIGGQLQIVSSPGGGTVIQLSLDTNARPKQMADSGS